MYTGVLDQNWIRKFFRSIGYPIGPPSKIYEENQAKVRRVLVDRITPQSRTPDVLITYIHEIHIRKIFDMVDTRSNMKLANLNLKPHVRRMIRNIIDCAIGARFYNPPESEHYKLLCLNQFYGPSYINCDQ